MRAVEIAISASNHATAGASIAAAILSYVGRPVRLWRGRRWDRGWGWQELRRETFRVEGAGDLRNRWLAIADVPDHDLLPESLPGRPAVVFRAGTEVGGADDRAVAAELAGAVVVGEVAGAASRRCCCRCSD